MSIRGHQRFRPESTIRKGVKDSVILVDHSNLLYRAWFVSGKRPYIAICKYFDMLRLCVRKVRQKGGRVSVIFCGESKTPLVRSKIDQDYKATRAYNKDDKFNKFRDELLACIKEIGYTLLRYDGYEADDVMASIAANTVIAMVSDIFIFSGDRDLEQCLAFPNVYIYRAPGLFVTPESFEEERGFSPDKYLIFKALKGDKSDNIKGVFGFGTVTATKSVQEGTYKKDVQECGPEAVEDFYHSLELSALNTSLDIFQKTNQKTILEQVPVINEKDILKKFDDKVLLELNRFALEIGG